MRVSYSPGYFVPLPKGHPFPMGKFPGLHKRLLSGGVIKASNVVEPQVSSWSDLLRVHTPAYLQQLANGLLNRAAIRRMGLPWSARLVHRSRLAVQGTINAAVMALEDGLAGNLAGGTHHAFPGYGEGFCVLNDVAVAIRTLQASQWIRRALIIDLDVHHGNGNAAFFSDDPDTYTFSMHGEKNFPFEKPASSYDVALKDGVCDDEYLATLKQHLPSVLTLASPDIVFYLAGIDVAAGDRFGRLSLSPDGIRRRDGYVIESVLKNDIPVVLLLSGGYASTETQTAHLHAICFEEAVAIANGVTARAAQ